MRIETTVCSFEKTKILALAIECLLYESLEQPIPSKGHYLRWHSPSLIATLPHVQTSNPPGYMDRLMILSEISQYDPISLAFVEGVSAETLERNESQNLEGFSEEKDSLRGISVDYITQECA